VIGEAHLAQRKGKTCESGREQGNRGREIIKGERGRNIKRGARKTNRKSQVKGGVASVGNSKSKRGRKVIGAITSPRVRLQRWRRVRKSSKNGLEVIGITR